MIGKFGNFFVTIIIERFNCGHTWQLKSFNQMVHSANMGGNGIITLKNKGNFISIKTFVVISIDVKNKLSYLLIFFGVIS